MKYIIGDATAPTDWTAVAVKTATGTGFTTGKTGTFTLDGTDTLADNVLTVSGVTIPTGSIWGKVKANPEDASPPKRGMRSCSH